MLARSFVMVWLVIAFSAVKAVASSSLPQPQETAILEIEGNISRTNEGGRALLSLDMIRALGVSGYSTRSPWLAGRARFKGVLLRDVLRYVGAAEGSRIHAKALDDYMVTIPWSDIMRYDVLLAFEVNGVTLTPRDKGPLWVVYPLDDHPELAEVEVNYRWIWQLKTLQVK